jgi:hypothetical protein
VTRDHDFASRGKAQIAREVVLHRGERYLTRRTCRILRATLALRLSR